MTMHSSWGIFYNTT